MHMFLLLAKFILLFKWTHSEYLSGFTTNDKEQKERSSSVINVCLLRTYRPSQIEMNKLILRYVNQQLLHCTENILVYPIITGIRLFILLHIVKHHGY